MTLNSDFLQSDLFNWLILPLLIFCARTCDVTLATLRNIFIARHIRKIVPVLGFFEVLIWLVAVSQTINNLHNIACYVAFAGGYSMGIFVGITIEEKLKTNHHEKCSTKSSNTYMSRCQNLTISCSICDRKL